MTVPLPPEFEKFVEELVASGRYTVPGEVVRHALQLLHDQETLNRIRLEALRQEVAVGLAELDRGESISLEGDEGLAAYFDQLKTELRAEQEGAAKKSA